MPAQGAASHERPRCSCHDEPMTKRNDRASGWRCSVKHRRASIKWWDDNPAGRYAHGRRRLRARIERKRQRIAESEGTT